MTNDERTAKALEDIVALLQGLRLDMREANERLFGIEFHARRIEVNTD